MKEVELPDFSDMFALAEKIRDLTAQKLRLELELAAMKANIVLVAMSDSKYFQKEKPPAMNFLETTYLSTGFNGELLGLRSELINIISELDEAKLTMQIYRDMISLYQTESANKRSATMV